MQRKKRRWLALILVFAMVLAGCGSGAGNGGEATSNTSSEGPKNGGILKVAIIGNPPTLDIHSTTIIITESTMNNVMENLFTFNDKFEPIPMLAESFEWKNDNTQLVVKLRQGVPFHNGKEMQAEDVKASIERWLRLASLGKTFAPKVESINATDKYTVEFNLNAKVGTLVGGLANLNNGAAIMPKEILDEAGDIPVKHPIGTGPYKLEEFLQDRYIRLVRFDDYAARSEKATGYGGKKVAYADEIQFIPVPEAQTRRAGVQTGEYHFAIDIPQDYYESLKTTPGLQPVIGKPYGWTGFIFNKKQGPVSNVKVRQAIQAAIDPAAAMKAAFGNEDFIRLTSSIVAKEHPYWGEFDGGLYNKPDVNRAKQLLQEAGYDGTPIRILTSKEYDFLYKMSVIAKQDMEAAGMNVVLDVVDWATLAQRRTNPELMDIFTTFFSFSPMAGATNPILNPAWPGWWENPDVKQAYDVFNASASAEEQKKAWDEIQTIFWQDIPVALFGEFFGLHIKHDSLKGYEYKPNLVFFNTWINEE
jgi:peptide/nickel transport system substrate-binding protein